MKVENLHAVFHFKHPTCIQLHYARDFGTTALESAKRIRKKEEETTKYKAGTLPLNMYQTAIHRGERLEFAPVERVEQPEFSKEEGRGGAPTSRDPGDDQLSEYDDDSSDNDSDDFAVEEDGAIRDMQNEELGFLFARGTQREYSSKPLEHSIVKRMLVLKR